MLQTQNPAESLKSTVQKRENNIEGNTRSLAEWVKIGSVVIDSGSIVVGDPCYVVEYSYDALANAYLNRKPLPNIVLSETGLGDGEYDVEARYEDAPRYGKCVAELRIKFDPIVRDLKHKQQLEGL